MAGSEIGNGVIIGAGAVVAGKVPDYAVVAGKVPDYAVVAGNRATIQRMRFDGATIAKLNQIAWWDWDITDILANEAAIVGADIDALIQAAN